MVTAMISSPFLGYVDTELRSIACDHVSAETIHNVGKPAMSAAWGDPVRRTATIATMSASRRSNRGPGQCDVRRERIRCQRGERHRDRVVRCTLDQRRHGADPGAEHEHADAQQIAAEADRDDGDVRAHRVRSPVANATRCRR